MRQSDARSVRGIDMHNQRINAFLTGGWVIHMLELSGKYNTAKVFTEVIEQGAISQIINMCNQRAFEGSKIRIMPDVHAGKGCTIGTTMTIEDKVVPNLVGVDIGCGMEVCILDTDTLDFGKLDRVIRERVPSGFAIRSCGMFSLRYPSMKQIFPQI